ncbi:MAG TPA: DUF1350 family protein [Leptolyngbyaceae cyanobacterium]
MDILFKFEQVGASQITIHPNPQGIEQFLGGYRFASFPALLHHYLLQHIFEQSYTIITLPFSLSSNHWEGAATLYNEHQTL